MERARIVALSWDGLGVPAIAGQLGCHPKKGGHRVKAPLEYSRGPDKTWVYGGLRVKDGQEVTLCAPSRNSAQYQRFLEQAEDANPDGTIYVITGNLSSHDSKATRAWLEDHPRIRHAFIPKRACRLNLQEGWRACGPGAPAPRPPPRTARTVASGAGGPAPSAGGGPAGVGCRAVPRSSSAPADPAEPGYQVRLAVTLDPGLVPAGLQYQHLGRIEPLVAAMASDHSLARQTTVQIHQLAATSRFIDFRSGTTLWTKVQEMSQVAGTERQVMCELGNIIDMVRLAATGVGVAIVPRAFTEPTEGQPDPPEGISAVPLAEPDANLTIGLSCDKARTTTAAIRAFTDLLIEHRLLAAPNDSGQGAASDVPWTVS